MGNSIPTAGQSFPSNQNVNTNGTKVKGEVGHIIVSRKDENGQWIQVGTKKNISNTSGETWSVVFVKPTGGWPLNSGGVTDYKLELFRKNSNGTHDSVHDVEFKISPPQILSIVRINLSN